MTAAQYITLQAWAEQKFNPVPHPNTLRRWATDGTIIPPPFKVGGVYMVLPNARHCNEPAPLRLVSRMTHGVSAA